jgi:hypothetical protein
MCRAHHPATHIVHQHGDTIGCRYAETHTTDIAYQRINSLPSLTQSLIAEREEMVVDHSNLHTMYLMRDNQPTVLRHVAKKNLLIATHTLRVVARKRRAIERAVIAVAYTS